MLYENRCRKCQEVCDYVYCAQCAENAKCTHGNRADECEDCGIEGDLAFDSRRERNH
jgi:hypothetical protein